LLSNAANSTSNPSANCASVFVVSSTSSFFIDTTPLKLVPFGALSFTFAVVGAVPLLLSSNIVYVISSPAFTFVPSPGFTDFVTCKSGLFTVTSTSSSCVLSFSVTTATFFNVFVSIPSANSSTVTLNSTIVCPATSVPSSFFPFAGTFTVIPAAKSADVYVVSSDAIITDPCTMLNPSGIVSVTTASVSLLPVFVTVILYTIVCPSNT